MKKIIFCLLVFGFLGIHASTALADSGGAAAIIRAGLLGAGSGAIGGAASGADSEDLWIAALTGAGVNIVGGSLLDVITNDNGTATRRTIRTQPVRVPSRNMTYRTNRVKRNNFNNKVYSRGFEDGYEAGYASGFKEGYLAAYKEAYKQGYADGLRNSL